jgi:hypothetical protein
MFKTTRTCPNCGTSLTGKDIRPAGPFACPVCRNLLRASKNYPFLTFVGSLSFAAVVFAALGFSGDRLVHALLWSVLPIIYLNARFLKYLILPEIELYEPDITRRSLY